MKLWYVYDGDRWGYSKNIVWAPSPGEAGHVVNANVVLEWDGRSREWRGKCHRMFVVKELTFDPTSDFGPTILWCEDESPDSPRED